VERYWGSTKPRVASLRHPYVSALYILVDVYSCIFASYNVQDDRGFFLSFFFFLNSATLTLLAIRPEPHILLFRRPLGTDPQTGRVDPELLRQAKEEYANQFGLLQKT
jgi:hypothetical protein